MQRQLTHSQSQGATHSDSSNHTTSSGRKSQQKKMLATLADVSV